MARSDLERTQLSVPALSPTLISGGAPPSEPLDPPLGTAVGELQLESLLAHGGMSTVYRAVQRQTGLGYAVKVLNRKLLTLPEIVARFQNELAIVARLRSDHIVRHVSQGLLPSGQPYAVMELIEAPTLAARQSAQPLELSEARDLLLQLCDALGEIHQQGVVHRDLKPENIFLLPVAEGGLFLKLSDFGLARGGETQALTREGALLGTPEYMSPEQCEGRPADTRSDLYALGVVAFELTAGRRPFSARMPMQLLLAHLRQPPPLARELRPELPVAWDQVLQRALAKEPQARFQSAAELAEAIRAALPDAELAQVPTRSSPRLLVDLPASLSVDGGAPERVRLSEISAGGAFVVGALPEHAQRLRISIDRLGPGSWLEATPVRRATHGIAIRFLLANEGERTAVLELLNALRTTQLAPRPEVLQRFAEHGQRDLYALLGQPRDATFEALTAAARKLDAALAEQAQACEQAGFAGELAMARQALEGVRSVLTSPRTRVAHDAAIGNWRGVALALGGHLREAERAELQRTLHDARPGAEIQKKLYLGRAALAESCGDIPGALQELEHALAIDPLALELHQRHAALLARSSAPRG